jgi:hypothetical protein
MKFLGWEEGVAPPSLRNLFDDFCDSSVLGMRRVLFLFLFPSLLNCDDKANALILSSLIRNLHSPPVLLTPFVPDRCFSIL